MKHFELKFWYTIYIGGRIPCRKLHKKEIIEDACTKYEAQNIAWKKLQDIKKEFPRCDEYTVMEVNKLKASMVNQ